MRERLHGAVHTTYVQRQQQEEQESFFVSSFFFVRPHVDCSSCQVHSLFSRKIKQQQKGGLKVMWAPPVIGTRMMISEQEERLAGYELDRDALSNRLRCNRSSLILSDDHHLSNKSFGQIGYCVSIIPYYIYVHLRTFAVFIPSSVFSNFPWMELN